MKVTRSMLHKDLRRGSFIRKMAMLCHSEATFRRRYATHRKSKGVFPPDLNVEEAYVDRGDGTQLRVLVVRSRDARPAAQQPAATGVMYIHGGGYALGIPELSFGVPRIMLANSNAVIVMPDYTKAVVRPYPAALEDCHAALVWMKNNAQSLGINRNQLFVAGDSAGGGLTAAVTLVARDRGEVNVAFQMPLYPMLDDRMTTESMCNNNAPLWDAKANAIAWRLYLGDLYQTESVPCYAAPARATNYAGLPPTYTFVGTIEPFYDETVTYVNNLKQAGVLAKIDEYEGCFHAFDQAVPNCGIAKQATRKWVEEFVYATRNHFAENR